MPLDLDAVDWRSLKHAYGPADDVPNTLKSLAEGKATAEEAAGELWGNIWHQGTVYEATAHAVPFLVEALQNKRLTDKEWLLVLLSNLATGSSYRAVHGHLLTLETAEVFEAGKAQELQWVRQAHEAVRQGIPVYLALLESRRSAVRTAAALALSSFPEEARNTAPPVRSRLEREKNHDVQASLMLCLGALLDPDPATRQGLEKALQARRNDSQRLAAAVSLIRLDKAKAGQKPVSVLQDTLADPENFSEAFVFSIWEIEADPGVALYDVLKLLGRERSAAAFIELLRRMEEPIDPLVDALLDTTFEEHRNKTITLEMLTPLQKSALTALLAADAAWSREQTWNTSSVGTHTGQYGLPARRAEVGMLLMEGNR